MVTTHSIDAVFHRLWTRARRAPDYDKGEWKELQDYLEPRLYGRPEGESDVPSDFLETLTPIEYAVLSLMRAQVPSLGPDDVVGLLSVFRAYDRGLTAQVGDLQEMAIRLAREQKIVVLREDACDDG